MIGFFWMGLAVALGYIANYGYNDGSGNYYIVIDSDKCDGCKKCVEACPTKIFEVELDDYDDPVAFVKHKMTKDLKYICGPCKPTSGKRELKCEQSCPKGAIKHSW
jgi:NAD-dependent dihydropyrimidine dehydrogenase PreA subunit